MAKKSDYKVKSFEQLVQASRVLKEKHKKLLLRNFNDLSDENKRVVLHALNIEQDRMKAIESIYSKKVKKLNIKYEITVENFHKKMRTRAEGRSRAEDQNKMEDLFSKLDQG